MQLVKIFDLFLTCYSWNYHHSSTHLKHQHTNKFISSGLQALVVINTKKGKYVDSNEDLQKLVTTYLSELMEEEYV